jgi:hypothetical protein
MNFITELKPNEVFVFGSNTAGRHGAGAAKWAAQHFGAQPGVGSGTTGKCYAIPTKDRNLQTLALLPIQFHVVNFLDYATCYPDTKFLLTPIGCGLAGYRPIQIAPMFFYAPSNVILPPEFTEVLSRFPRD